MYQFLSSEHEYRFSQLCKRDRTHRQDIERRTLFFIVAGNDSLYENVELAYDFEDQAIKLEVLENAFLTGGTRSLVCLAFSLYGHGSVCDVRQLFNSLDYENSVLAVEAVRGRFKILAYPDYRTS